MSFPACKRVTSSPNWGRHALPILAAKRCARWRSKILYHREATFERIIGKTTKGDKQMTKCHNLLANNPAFYFIDAWSSNWFQPATLLFFHKIQRSTSTPPDQPLQPHLVEATWRTGHPPAGPARQGIFEKVWFQIGSLLRLQQKCCLANRTLKIF